MKRFCAFLACLAAWTPAAAGPAWGGQLYTEPGSTFFDPALPAPRGCGGCRRILVTAVGGEAGDSGTANGFVGGGPGMGTSVFDVSPGTTYVVKVGKGGRGTTPGGSSGFGPLVAGGARAATAQGHGADGGVSGRNLWSCTAAPRSSGGGGDGKAGFVSITPLVSDDRVKPRITIVSPSNGATLRGPIEVRAVAEDKDGIAGVQFILDGVRGSVDAEPPFEASWMMGPGGPLAGRHEVRAIAFDAAGYDAVSEPVVVVVGPPADIKAPTVRVASPAAGAELEGQVKVVVAASDESGVTRLEIHIDGNLRDVDTAPPFELDWDTRKSAPGGHELSAVAFDAAGNRSKAEPVAVTVLAPRDAVLVDKIVELPPSDAVKPAVAITAPAKGAQVTGTVTVKATASDDRGVAGVQFVLDGKELGAADTAAPYEVSWDASKAAPGPHELRAVAFDAAGNNGVSEAVVVTVAGDVPAPSVDPQYLLFQLFTFAPGPAGKAAPFDKAAVGSDIDAIISAVAGARGDGKTRQLGFSVGPLALDHSDEQLRETVRRSFELALEKNVAVAVHLDDSMFWRGRPHLWNWFDPKQPGYDPANKDNVEWRDWGVALSTPRFIGWAPTTLAPQMCFNSPKVKAEVVRLARDVIGAEVKKGLDALRAAGKEHLFAGVIAGWETRLDDDRQPRVKTGYCALHHLGYSAAKPPADFDLALEGVVRDFAAHWTASLRQAGIPKERLYTHFAPTGDSPQDGHEYVHAPVRSAFNDSSRPGFSFYSSTIHNSRIQAELSKRGSPRWANAEGTNISLVDAFNGGEAAVPAQSWERYLGLAFNHGAALSNIFAWQSPLDDPFGSTTRSAQAIAAYKKFLSGGELDDVLPSVAIAAPGLGAAVKGTVAVTASASDGAGVVKVQFLVDGAVVSTDTAAPYGFSWDTTALPPGAYSLEARAFDAAGNAGRALVEVAVERGAANAAPEPPPGGGGEIVLPERPAAVSSGTVRAFSGGRVGDAKKQRVEITVPSGAVPTDTEIIIRAEDKGDPAREAAKRAHERSKSLARAGASAEITAFTGSEGSSVTTFRTPVRVILGYDPGEAVPERLGIYYWHETAKIWKEVPGAVVDRRESLITVSVDHLTTFAVFAVPQSAAGLAFGEVFVFPNPAKGRFATLHVETDAAVERLDISFYDLAGSRVHGARLTGAPAAGVNGKPAYEFAWDTAGIAAGGYLYAVEAYRDGRSVRALGKFAVVK